jgi:hypothetical protein
MTLKPPAAVRAALASALTFLRKLPIAKYLKPIWKGALIEAVQGGGDKLQAEIDELIQREGLAALPKVHALIDDLQAKFAALVRAVPCLPANAEEEVIDEVNRAVDGLQQRLTGAVASDTAAAAQAAFDAAFDRFQDELKARISDI